MLKISFSHPFEACSKWFQEHTDPDTTIRKCAQTCFHYAAQIFESTAIHFAQGAALLPALIVGSITAVVSLPYILFTAIFSKTDRAGYILTNWEKDRKVQNKTHLNYLVIQCKTISLIPPQEFIDFIESLKPETIEFNEGLLSSEIENLLKIHYNTKDHIHFDRAIHIEKLKINIKTEEDIPKKISLLVERKIRINILEIVIKSELSKEEILKHELILILSPKSIEILSS